MLYCASMRVTHADEDSYPLKREKDYGQEVSEE
jgi:hypothetical protein